MKCKYYSWKKKDSEGFGFDCGSLQSIIRVGSAIGLSWGNYGVVSCEEHKGHLEYKKLFKELKELKNTNQLKWKKVKLILKKYCINF